MSLSKRGVMVKTALLFFLTLTVFQAHGFEGCGALFAKPAASEFSVHLIHDVAEQAEKNMRARGMTGLKVRGYAILIGGMVGAGAMNGFISTQLVPNSPFLSVTMATTLGAVLGIGVSSIGGAIIEPLSNKVRQMSFVTAVNAESRSPFAKYLEDIWFRLQQRLSLNAQMTRNGVTQYLTSIQQNFFEAHRAMNSSNPEYAAGQVAVAAFRLRLLFQEIPANDLSVQFAVKESFTNHVEMDQNFIHLVWQKLEKADPEFAAYQTYYQAVLDSWLTR